MTTHHRYTNPELNAALDECADRLADLAAEPESPHWWERHVSGPDREALRAALFHAHNEWRNARRPGRTR